MCIFNTEELCSQIVCYTNSFAAAKYKEILIIFVKKSKLISNKWKNRAWENILDIDEDEDKYKAAKRKLLYSP